MLNKKAIIFFIFLFLLASVIYGAKPGQTVDLTTPTGITIIYPKLSYFKQFDIIKLHFHTFDSNYSILTNVTTDCFLHIYNDKDSHIFTGEIPFDSLDTEWELIYPNTTRLGIYPYLVYCNDSKKEGGFVSESFYITPDGNEWDKALNWKIFFGYFLIISILLYMIHKFREDQVTPLIYGIIGATISFIFAGMFLIRNFSLGITWANSPVSILILAIGLYFSVISLVFYNSYKPKPEE